MSWYWDYVKIHEPCVTWEFCGDVTNCGFSILAYWKSGKRVGVATTCTECNQRNYTITVIATTN